MKTAPAGGKYNREKKPSPKSSPEKKASPKQGGSCKDKEKDQQASDSSKHSGTSGEQTKRSWASVVNTTSPSKQSTSTAAAANRGSTASAPAGASGKGGKNSTSSSGAGGSGPGTAKSGHKNGRHSGKDHHHSSHNIKENGNHGAPQASKQDPENFNMNTAGRGHDRDSTSKRSSGSSGGGQSTASGGGGASSSLSQSHQGSSSSSSSSSNGGKHDKDSNNHHTTSSATNNANNRSWHHNTRNWHHSSSYYNSHNSNSKGRNSRDKDASGSNHNKARASSSSTSSSTENHSSTPTAAVELVVERGEQEAKNVGGQHKKASEQGERGLDEADSRTSSGSRGGALSSGTGPTEISSWSQNLYRTNSNRREQSEIEQTGNSASSSSSSSSAKGASRGKSSAAGKASHPGRASDGKDLKAPDSRRSREYDEKEPRKTKAGGSFPSGRGRATTIQQAPPDEDPLLPAGEGTNVQSTGKKMTGGPDFSASSSSVPSVLAGCRVNTTNALAVEPVSLTGNSWPSPRNPSKNLDVVRCVDIELTSASGGGECATKSSSQQHARLATDENTATSASSPTGGAVRREAFSGAGSRSRIPPRQIDTADHAPERASANADDALELEERLLEESLRDEEEEARVNRERHQKEKSRPDYGGDDADGIESGQDETRRKAQEEIDEVDRDIAELNCQQPAHLSLAAHINVPPLPSPHGGSTSGGGDHKANAKGAPTTTPGGTAVGMLSKDGSFGDAGAAPGGGSDEYLRASSFYHDIYLRRFKGGPRDDGGAGGGKGPMVSGGKDPHARTTSLFPPRTGTGWFFRGPGGREMERSYSSWRSGGKEHGGDPRERGQSGRLDHSWSKGDGHRRMDENGGGYYGGMGGKGGGGGPLGEYGGGKHRDSYYGSYNDGDGGYRPPPRHDRELYHADNDRHYSSAGGAHSSSRPPRSYHMGGDGAGGYGRDGYGPRDQGMVGTKGGWGSKSGWTRASENWGATRRVNDGWGKAGGYGGSSYYGDAGRGGYGGGGGGYGYGNGSSSYNSGAGGLGAKGDGKGRSSGMTDQEAALSQMITRVNKTAPSPAGGSAAAGGGDLNNAAAGGGAIPSTNPTVKPPQLPLPVGVGGAAALPAALPGATGAVANAGAVAIPGAGLPPLPLPVPVPATMHLSTNAGAGMGMVAAPPGGPTCTNAAPPLQLPLPMPQLPGGPGTSMSNLNCMGNNVQATASCQQVPGGAQNVVLNGLNNNPAQQQHQNSLVPNMQNPPAVGGSGLAQNSMQLQQMGSAGGLIQPPQRGPMNSANAVGSSNMINSFSVGGQPQPAMSSMNNMNPPEPTPQLQGTCANMMQPPPIAAPSCTSPMNNRQQLEALQQQMGGTTATGTTSTLNQNAQVFNPFSSSIAQAMNAGGGLPGVVAGVGGSSSSTSQLNSNVPPFVPQMNSLGAGTSSGAAGPRSTGPLPNGQGLMLNLNLGGQQTMQQQLQDSLQQQVFQHQQNLQQGALLGQGPALQQQSQYMMQLFAQQAAMQQQNPLLAAQAQAMLSQMAAAALVPGGPFGPSGEGLNAGKGAAHQFRTPDLNMGHMLNNGGATASRNPFSTTPSRLRNQNLPMPGEGAIGGSSGASQQQQLAGGDASSAQNQHQAAGFMPPQQGGATNSGAPVGTGGVPPGETTNQMTTSVAAGAAANAAGAHAQHPAAVPLNAHGLPKYPWDIWECEASQVYACLDEFLTKVVKPEIPAQKHRCKNALAALGKICDDAFLKTTSASSSSSSSSGNSASSSSSASKSSSSSSSATSCSSSLIQLNQYVKKIRDTYGHTPKAITCQPFGSFIQNTNVRLSDLDVAMCFEMKSCDESGEFKDIDGVSFVQEILFTLESIFKNQGPTWRVQDCLPLAAVPVLKLVFEEALVLDISVRAARHRGQSSGAAQAIAQQQPHFHFHLGADSPIHPIIFTNLDLESNVQLEQIAGTNPGLDGDGSADSTPHLFQEIHVEHKTSRSCSRSSRDAVPAAARAVAGGSDETGADRRRAEERQDQSSLERSSTQLLNENTHEMTAVDLHETDEHLLRSASELNLQNPDDSCDTVALHEIDLPRSLTRENADDVATTAREGVETTTTTSGDIKDALKAVDNLELVDNNAPSSSKQTSAGGQSSSSKMTSHGSKMTSQADSPVDSGVGQVDHEKGGATVYNEQKGGSSSSSRPAAASGDDEEVDHTTKTTLQDTRDREGAGAAAAGGESSSAHAPGVSGSGEDNKLAAAVAAAAAASAVNPTTSTPAFRAIQKQAQFLSSTALVKKRDQIIREQFAKVSDVVQATVYAVKHWSKCEGLNCTYKGGLNSLSWLLLVFAHYRQRHPTLLDYTEASKKQGMKGCGRDCGVPDSHVPKHIAQFYFWLHELTMNPRISVYVDVNLDTFLREEEDVSQMHPVLYIEDPMQHFNIFNNTAQNLLPHVWRQIGEKAEQEMWRYVPGRIAEVCRNPSLDDLKRVEASII